MIRTSAVFAPLVLLAAAMCAACSASAGDSIGEAQASKLLQNEGWAISSADAPTLRAALQDAGVSGYQNPNSDQLQTYAAVLSCDTAAGTCTVAASTDAHGDAGAPTVVGGSTASALIDVLTRAGAAADGPLTNITVHCDDDTSTSPLQTYCDANKVIDKPAPNEKTFTSGVGSLVSYGSLTTSNTDGTSYDNVSTYEIIYQDVNGYFAGASSVAATIVETTQLVRRDSYSDAPQTSSFDVQLSSTDSKTYKGTFVITLGGEAGYSETDLDSLAVAFHAGSTWDSNNSANYGL